MEIFEIEDWRWEKNIEGINGGGEGEVERIWVKRVMWDS